MLTTIQEKTTTYISKVFGWMFYAMALSGISALFVYSSKDLQRLILENSSAVLILGIVQIAVVFVLSLAINKINSIVAFILFSFYSVLTGLTLSGILFVYDINVLGGAFLMTAGIYGVMSVIGYSTKINLNGLGLFAFMAMIGLIFASIVNIFLGSTMLETLISIAAIFIFSALTAYDVQKIKEAAQYGVLDTKASIVFALSMYLNFINIFLSILNLLDND